MELFNRYGIRVFATDLPNSTPGRGPDRLQSERAAVGRLLRETFPDDILLSIGHHKSGAPFLTRLDADDTHPSIPSGVPLPEISISHCKGLAVLAVGPVGTKIGVDCESANRFSILRRVAPRFLSEKQTSQWGEPPALLWAWCIKEAAYKASGQPGLVLQEIPLPPEPPTGETNPGTTINISGQTYHVLRISVPDHSEVVMLVFALPDPRHRVF